jgi:hypothetical protein
MKQVIQQLKAIRRNAQMEMISASRALMALGANPNGDATRKLSKAAREKIAAAQRRRWAKVRREKK